MTDPQALPGDAVFMQSAVQAARRSLAAGGPPVGACIVHDGELVAAGANEVAAGPDPTAHAEVVAIRAACRALRTTDLRGSTLYVTVEPCPMCMAACHYAGIGRVVFGAGIDRLHAITGNELRQPPALSLVPGVEAAACRELLDEWAATRRGRA